MSRENKLKAKSSTSTRLSLKSNSTKAVLIVLCALFVKVNWSNKLDGRLAGFEWRLPIALDTAVVKTDQLLFDFPLYLDIQHEDLKIETHGGKLHHPEGYDIRFAAKDGGTPLMHEVISFDPEKGKLKAWVNLDTLDGKDVNGLYLYYGAFIDVTERDFHIGERKLKGHFYHGGNLKSAKKNMDFSKEWMSLEVANQKLSTSFVLLAEKEEVKSELPIKLQHFKSGIKGGKIMLVEWATALEYYNEYFVLERSSDAKTYTEISQIGGGLLSEHPLRYSFSDENPFADGTYYRLKQVNLAGKFTFSHPIYVAFDQNDFGIKVGEIGPNPFKEEFTAHFSSSKPGKATMQFFDEIGNLLSEEVLSIQKGPNSYTYRDPDNVLPKGGYVFTLMGSDRKLKVAHIQKDTEDLPNVSD